MKPRALEYEMPYKNVGDTSLYYEIHGQGYPLLMIRGLGSNADHWYSQLPALAAKYKVVVFDNRGIARSSDPGGGFGAADMAARMSRLAAAASSPEWEPT